MNTELNTALARRQHENCSWEEWEKRRAAKAFDVVGDGELAGPVPGPAVVGRVAAAEGDRTMVAGRFRLTANETSFGRSRFLGTLIDKSGVPFCWFEFDAEDFGKLVTGNSVPVTIGDSAGKGE